MEADDEQQPWQTMGNGGGSSERRSLSQRPSSSNLHESTVLDGSTRFSSLPRAFAQSVRRRPTADDEGANPVRRSMYERSKSYDDHVFHKEVQTGGAGNGVRVWYDSYTTIDWIHDAVKDNSRLRRIRGIRGARGALINLWDRLQGWVIVTITGLITALIAAAIVKSEAVLFDLKEGYCSRDWRLAKRFCCPYGDQPDWDGGGSMSGRFTNSTTSAWSYHSRLISTDSDRSKGLITGFGNRMLAGWAAPVATSPHWRASGLDESVTCPDWTTWADKLHLSGDWNFVGEYGVYILIAVLWASIASVLTIYLTSSELYVNRKEPLLAHTSTGTAPVSAAVSPTLESRRPIDADERTSLLRKNGKRYDRRPTNILSDAANASRSDEALEPRKVLYFGSGSGISEVKCILGGFVVHGYLGFWTLFTKSVGLALSVASGLSLGKEGPFVHIASCVGNIVCRLFYKYETNESKRREILSCACAAGVAVAFGAPVGGVLFSLEEVSYYFPASVLFSSFFCAMVAAATLRFLDPFGTGKIVLFQVTYDKDWHWIELGFFVVLGIFGGVYGALFTKLNMLWSKRVRATTWMARHPLYEVMLITVVTVGVSFMNDYTRMGGPELIADLFSECHEHESLEGLCVSRPSQIGPLVSSVAWAMLVKGVLTIVTFGIKLPAGIFIPTLCVGACFGRIIGLLVQYAQWTHPDSGFFAWCGTEKANSACIVPGVYAMIGAAATLSGVTRTTISLVVIMFELTGTLTYSVPVMLSVLVARTVADGLEHKGIYDLVLEFSGMPYLDAKEEHTWEGVSIVDALDADVEVIDVDEDNTVASLRKKLERLAVVTRNPDGGFPIICNTSESKHSGSRGTKRRRLMGYIAAQELEHGLNRILAAEDGEADPARLTCAFNFLPRPDRQPHERVDNDESVAHETTAEEYMRDSTLLASIDSPRDLSIFVDRAPITLTTCSPLELVHQMFVKLGVRYLIVLNANGTLNGVIFKKRWLTFLHSLDERTKHA